MPSNNCADTTVRIDVPYWDLQLTINAPQTMARNQWHTWNVKVRNAGNVWSPACSVRTAITQRSGNHDWLDAIFNQCGPGPIQSQGFNSIGPGLEITLPFGMCIHWGALSRWQHLKAALNPFTGCDQILGGNYDERQVFIQ